MIAVIVHHYPFPDKESQADTLIRQNGKNMRVFSGFIARYTLATSERPRKISTVTIWRNKEDQEKWAASEVRKRAASAAGELWSTKPEAESYEVIPELQ